MKKKIKIILAGTIGAVALLTVGQAALQEPEQSGPLAGPILNHTLNSVAEDAGITISAKAVSFSGTRTLVEVEVATTGVTDTAGQPAVAIIPTSAVRGDPAFGVMEDLRVPLEADRTGTGLLRLSSPAVTSAPGEVTITSVDLRAADGQSVRVNGRWALQVTFPSNIATLLRTEELAPAGNIMDSGVELRVLGAIRSSAETLVTWTTVSSDAIVPLGQPILKSGDQELLGEQVSASEDGKVVTYSFPPTPFGEAVQLSVGPFAKSGSGEALRIAFDLGAVMARNGILGKFGERAPVSAADVLQHGPNPAVEVDFARTAEGREDLLGITVVGNWDYAPDTRLVLGDGTELSIWSATSSYRTDPTGGVSQGITRFGFQFTDPEALKGTVTLGVAPPDVMLRGAWEVSLTPSP